MTIRMLFCVAFATFLVVACKPSTSDTTENTAVTNTTDSLATAVDESLLFKRNTIVVADMDRSLSVYRDILGFEIFQISESDEDSYSYPVFNIPKEAKIRFATLNSPSQVRTLALTEITGMELPQPIQEPRMSAMVIKVEDIAEKMEAIASLGLEITKPKEAGSAGGEFRFIEQAFVDFDGHLVVLYEIL